jgi:hypothetical protein
MPKDQLLKELSARKAKDRKLTNFAYVYSLSS